MLPLLYYLPIYEHVLSFHWTWCIDPFYFFKSLGIFFTSLIINLFNPFFLGIIKTDSILNWIFLMLTLNIFFLLMWRVAVDSSPPAAYTDLLVISLGSAISSSTLMVDSLGLNYLDIIKHTKTLMRYFLLCRKETAGALLASFVFLRKWCWENYFWVNWR